MLIIEDDYEANQLLSEIFARSGYATTSAYTGFDGLDLAARDDFDLVLLDLMLPYKSGDRILQELRRRSDVPVIVISAKDTGQVKVDLLRLGADDYVTKPFDVDEVLARAESTLRRAGKAIEPRATLSYKDISLDESSWSVTVSGNLVTLTATEFRLLAILMRRPNLVHSKKSLFEALWGDYYAYDDKLINTHMSNLRKKLKSVNPETSYIETVWGIGYKLHR
ncbi:response regulator transcription factor [Phytoactinopolyspora halophila]|uniref:response regulator transcription factor n=1 Tax=Phytoactinopolyspora halophila TaxID=1981511 RepID=UPI001B8C0004|nr:response regulator transcription factor [Phytoactinopolyspora halophila]